MKRISLPVFILFGALAFFVMVPAPQARAWTSWAKCSDPPLSTQICDSDGNYIGNKSPNGGSYTLSCSVHNTGLEACTGYACTDSVSAQSAPITGTYTIDEGYYGIITETCTSYPPTSGNITFRNIDDEGEISASASNRPSWTLGYYGCSCQQGGRYCTADNGSPCATSLIGKNPWGQTNSFYLSQWPNLTFGLKAINACTPNNAPQNGVVGGGEAWVNFVDDTNAGRTCCISGYSNPPAGAVNYVPSGPGQCAPVAPPPTGTLNVSSVNARTGAAVSASWQIVGPGNPCDGSHGGSCTSVSQATYTNLPMGIYTLLPDSQNPPSGFAMRVVQEDKAIAERSMTIPGVLAFWQNAFSSIPSAMAVTPSPASSQTLSAGSLSASWTIKWDPLAQIAANPGSLSLNASALSRQVALSNSGQSGSTLGNLGSSVSYTNGSNWLSVSSLAGISLASGQSTNVTITANPTGLAAGTYSAGVVFSGHSQGNELSTSTISVVLVVSPQATAALSINKDNFYVGDPWVLTLSTANVPAGSHFQLCANNGMGCFGDYTLDGTGKVLSGTWTAGYIGNWTMRAKFSSPDIQSNQVSFTVSAAPTASLGINQTNFSVGDNWTLTLSTANVPASSHFQLCANNGLGCWGDYALNGGGNWSESGTFGTGEIGNWTMSAQFASPAVSSNQISFTVSPAGRCTKDSDCNDGNACTTDTCNTTTGACSHAVVPGTHKECSGAACQSKPNSSSACTDSCSDDSSCVPPPSQCQGGQTYPHAVCDNGSCVGVAACGYSECASDSDCLPPLTVSLLSTTGGGSGYAPFTTALQSSVGGTAQGSVNYSFWWNCSYGGPNLTQAIAQCGDPDGTVGNANGNKFDGVNSSSQTSVQHTYDAAGSYTAKVLVERGSYSAEARATINVTPPPTHLGCVNQSCTSVQGAGSNTCSQNSDCVPPSCTINASPTSILAGSTSTVSWGCSGAGGGCTLNGSSVNPSSGSFTVHPTSTTQYLLSCVGSGGAGSQASITVTVSQNPHIREIAPP